MKRSCCLALLAAWSWAAPSHAAPTELPVVFDMDTVRHKPTEVTGRDKQKVPAGTAELVEGKFGQAVRFSFAGGLGAGFMTAPVKAGPEWDAAAGFSFFVKGDGSTNWGGIELIDRSNFALRYGYCFPLDSREWRKIMVPWQDLIPELAGPLVGAGRGYAPSGFGNFWFGKWFYWRDYPAHSFAIDQVTLEATISEDPPPAPPVKALQSLRDKLARREPITLVTMGDSLSDKRHWANQEVLWSEILAREIKSSYGSEVTLVNPAMGGTTLSQNLILAPCWARAVPRRDLVTVWFGYNDWDSGVRGPRFAEFLRLAVQRIRRLTGGQSHVLLMTTCPAHGRPDTMKEMEEAVKTVAAQTGAGLADVAAEVRRLGTPDAALAQGCWAWDKTHLGPKGHQVAARAVLQALGGQGPVPASR